MLPEAYLTEWSTGAPWPDLVQVEQDLILSRLLIEIANDEMLAKVLAFRGGTCLQKLVFSDDIAGLLVEMPEDYEVPSAALLVLQRLGARLRNGPAEGEGVTLMDDAAISDDGGRRHAPPEDLPTGFGE